MNYATILCISSTSPRCQQDTLDPASGQAATSITTSATTHRNDYGSTSDQLSYAVDGADADDSTVAFTESS